MLHLLQWQCYEKISGIHNHKHVDCLVRLRALQEQCSDTASRFDFIQYVVDNGIVIRECITNPITNTSQEDTGDLHTSGCIALVSALYKIYCSVFLFRSCCWLGNNDIQQMNIMLLRRNGILALLVPFISLVDTTNLLCQQAFHFLCSHLS